MSSSEALAAADLAPGGALRAAINLGNVVLAREEPGVGPAGVAVDLARELGARLALPVELVAYPTGGAVIPGLADGAWDVAFLAVEPERAERVAFTAPYVFIDATYLVRAASPFRSVAELDVPGFRIAIADGAAYGLALARRLRSATLVRAPTSPEALAVFQRDGLQAAAGIRQALVDAAAASPDLRVLEDNFSRIEQGIAVPKDRPLGAQYVAAFVEEMKASGFVRRALDRHGQGGTVVAPPAAAHPQPPA